MSAVSTEARRGRPDLLELELQAFVRNGLRWEETKLLFCKNDQYCLSQLSLQPPVELFLMSCIL